MDVSSDWTIEADYNYGDILSGLTVLLSQWNPWAKTKTVIICVSAAMMHAFCFFPLTFANYVLMAGLGRCLRWQISAPR